MMIMEISCKTLQLHMMKRLTLDTLDKVDYCNVT